MSDTFTCLVCLDGNYKGFGSNRCCPLNEYFNTTTELCTALDASCE